MGSTNHYPRSARIILSLGATLDAFWVPAEPHPHAIDTQARHRARKIARLSSGCVQNEHMERTQRAEEVSVAARIMLKLYSFDENGES